MGVDRMTRFRRDAAGRVSPSEEVGGKEEKREAGAEPEGQSPERPERSKGRPGRSGSRGGPGIRGRPVGSRGRRRCQTATDRERAGLTAWRPQGPCPLCSGAA